MTRTPNPAKPVHRITVTLEVELHERLKLVAERNRRSVDAQAAVFIEEGVEDELS